MHHIVYWDGFGVRGKSYDEGQGGKPHFGWPCFLLLLRRLAELAAADLLALKAAFFPFRAERQQQQQRKRTLS
jgi:hypothetical protein